MTTSRRASRDTWTRVAFGDVVKLCRDRSSNPRVDGLERYVGLEHLVPGDMSIQSWGSIADGTTFTSVFRPGHVLFGKRRAYQRKVAVADFHGVCSSDIYVLEPKGESLLPGLLPFLCQTEAFFRHALKTAAGGLSPRTNWKDLAKFEFALPPHEEQRRIEDVLNRCESLHRATVQAASVSTMTLVAARHRLMSRLSPDTESAKSRSTILPPRWSRRTLADIVEAPYGIVDGPFGSNLKSEHYRDSGYPVVQSAFVASGAFDPHAADWVYVDESKFQEQHRSAVRAGDIVMVKVGVNCGACDVVPAGQPTGILAGNCLKISPKREICDTRFLLHYLKWLREVGLLERHVTSTQQRALTLGRLKGQRIILPPLSEQEYSVRVLDSCQRAESDLAERKAAVTRMAKLLREEALA